MPKCKNDKTKTYKGTEPSPKGLGYCGHAEKLGQKRKGKDGNQWIIKEIKNGSKRWTKVPTKVKTHYERYFKPMLTSLSSDNQKTIKKLLTETKKKIQKAGIKVFVVPVHLENGYYLSDYAWNFVADKEGDDFLDIPFIIISLKINNDKLETKDGGIYIQHNVRYKKKKELQEILRTDFGKKYIWNKSITRAIFIKF
tara:strand:+ start:221 stop:811 length:591 start_codon:yes stop_codon:yes gene_type:complete